MVEEQFASLSEEVEVKTKKLKRFGKSTNRPKKKLKTWGKNL